MNLSTELTKQVSAHLDEVRKYLGNLPADERQEILQAIESHIYDALENRSDGEPTPSLLEAVIAEMDPPDSYGELPVAPKKSSWCLFKIAVPALALITLVAVGVKQWPAKELDLLGRWVSVDFVETIDQFDPKVRSVTVDFPFKELTFLPKGKTDRPFWTWEGKHLIHSGDHTSSKLVIKRILGEDYLFLEWISGDVTMRRQKPQYYVLKRGEYSSQPIKTPITEGVGWGDYLLGKTSIELIEALGTPQTNTPEWMMRWDKNPYIDVALSGANTCREVRFNRGFKGQTSAGIKLGSSFQEMLETYGEAELVWAKNTRSVIAQWPSKGIHIYTYDGYVSQIIISKPKPKSIHHFVDDPAIHGRWISVDFVNLIEQFNPKTPSWKGDLFLKELTFLADGATSHAWTWTKGKLISEKSLSSYTIKEIDGEDYLFVEWMSGDVTLRGQPPKYYVLKKDYSTVASTALPDLVPFSQGCNSLKGGDSIILTKVLSSSPHFAEGDTVVVKGQYTLSSQPTARLSLLVTGTRGRGRSNVAKEQQITVTRGSGKFELSIKVPYYGCPHLTFYETAEKNEWNPIGGLYFGTEEQVEEIERLKTKRAPQKSKLFLRPVEHPSSPQPPPGKYAFQVIKLIAPADIVQLPLGDITPVLQHPETKILEYPILIAGQGESITNDQRKTVSMTDDSNINKETGLAEKTTVRLGDFMSVTLNSVEDGEINYHINISHRELAGFFNSKTENGFIVKTNPRFKIQKIDTELTQKLGSWFSLSGIIEEQADGKKINQITCIRVISPDAISHRNNIKPAPTPSIIATDEDVMTQRIKTQERMREDREIYPQDELRESEPNTLKAKTPEGDEAQIQLISFNPTTSLVEIKETNGAKKKVALSAFCPKDQSSIQNWHSTFSLLSRKKLRFTINKEYNKSLSYEGDLDLASMFPNNGYENGWKTLPPGITYDEVYYEITLRNQTGKPLNDIRVEYCIYHESEIQEEESLYTNTMGKDKYDKQVHMHHRQKLPTRTVSGTMHGEFIIPELSDRDRVTQTTKPLWLIESGKESRIEKATQQSERAQENSNSTTYRNIRRSLRGDVQGIRYRVYLPMSNGKYVMKEFADPLKLIGTTEWAEK